MPSQRNVLLCYRGRYREQVQALAEKLRTRGLSVSYDCEILAAPASSEAREVEWISLTADDPGGSTEWRAPLQQAIEGSEVVAFLVDPQDISPAVTNEVAWAARAGSHAFVIFDTRADTVSEETEGLYVSFLNVICSMALRRFEVPRYEHVVFAHQDPHELDGRLDVVVNRIEEYLQRVRREPLPPVRMDAGAHVSDIGKHPLLRARSSLESLQQRIHERLGLTAPPHQGDPYQEALEFAFQYEKGARVEGDFIRPPGSPFRYPLASERQRLVRTQRIIERVRPGKYEKHPLFALLARQAASIELMLESASDGKKALRRVVLLGTLPCTPVDEVMGLWRGDDYAIVLLDAAFLDFVYQVTKVSVCSWRLEGDRNAARASFSPDPADVIAQIEADPSLEDAFFRTLMGYVTGGFPAQSIEGAPAPAYQLPLSVLTNMAERFMIGRGYADLVVEETPGLPGGPARVLGLDEFATAYVLSSAAKLDGTDPSMALQGCGMPLICLDLIHRAAHTLDPAACAPEREGNPSLPERLKTLERAYLTLMEVQGVDRRRARNGLRPAHLAWQTPQLLWQRVEPRIASEREKCARSAWIWR